MCDNGKTEWQRPPGPLNVWRVIDGTRKGIVEEPVKLSIQEIPEDRYDDVLDYMQTYFITEEVLSSSLGIADDELARKDLCMLWVGALKQGISVAAFVQNSDNKKPEIAGVNILHVGTRYDKNSNYTQCKSDSATKILSVMGSLSEECNVWDRYNVDVCMDAYGLSVKPCFQGQKLAQKLLEARIDIGRKYNIPVTTTTFTSAIAQKAAARVGFDTYIERDYVKIVDEKGNLYFPKVKSKSIKLMGRKLI